MVPPGARPYHADVTHRRRREPRPAIDCRSDLEVSTAPLPTRKAGIIRLALLAASLMTALAAGRATLGAQEMEWDPTQTRVTRPELTALLQRYELAASSTAYSDSLKAEANQQVSLIRERLQLGDFRAGDKIAIWVEEHAPLSDTFDIAADQTVSLPGVGTVALGGVLRSELQPKVEEAVAQTIRNPRVRTQSMLRVAVEGSVTLPGHYLVDSDDPLSEVLMRGGAVTTRGRREGARVERGAETLVSAERFQEALRTGMTIDHLGMREGDRIFVPEDRSALFDTLRQYLLVIPALLGALTLFT